MRRIPRNSFLNQGNTELEKSTVIVSNHLAGHRIQYLVSFLNRSSESNKRIVLVLISKIEFGLSELQIRALQELDFEFIDDCKNSSEALDTAQLMATQFHRSEILFWDADNWILPLLVFRPKSRLLFMRPYLSNKSLKKVSLFLLKWSAIFFFHFIRGFDVRILGVPCHTPKLLPSLWVDDALLISPDGFTAASESNGTKMLFAIPQNSQVVLVPGFMGLRKNPRLVIEAIEIVSKSIIGDACLIFAGKSDLESSNIINNFGNTNIKHIDRYLSDAEYRQLLLVADVVILSYTNKGSSGIIIESLAYGKHVIISDSRLWTGATEKANGLLHPCKFNAASIADVIVQILSEKGSIPPVILAGMTRPTVIDFFQGSSGR